MVWSLVLCPDGTKEDPMVNGVEFEEVFLVKVHVLHPYSGAVIASASTIRVLRESASFGWS